MRRWFNGLAALIFVCSTIIVFLVVTSKRDSKASQVSSEERIQGISLMVLKYAADNDGRLPGQLSDLLMYHGDGITLELFYPPPYEGRARHWFPRDWRTDPSLLNVYSPYRIWSSRNSKDILVFETPKLWKDESSAVSFAVKPLATEIKVQNIEVKRLSKDKFIELIKSQGTPKPIPLQKALKTPP
jgi:hypothetical protein